MNGTIVSAILKALQKLEADSNSFQSWRMNVRTAGRSSPRFRGLLFWTIVLSVAVLAFAGGFIHIRLPGGGMNDLVPSIRSGSLSQPRENNAPPVYRKDPEMPPQSAQRMEPSPEARTVARSPSRPQPESYTGDTAGAGIAGSIPDNPQGAPAVQMDKEELQAPAKPDLRADRLSTPQRQHSGPLAPSASKTSIKKEAPSLPAFYDPSLTLQAIAWAEDPQSRIAVINGQILREGESIDDVIIDGIKEDRVIVRKGMEVMALLFRNQ